MSRLSNLSDDAILQGLHAIVGAHRRVTASLILHLGEVDARRLHVERGFSSLFSYSVEELRFSEDEACRRIEAARLARRFPSICPLLEAGAVSLTVLGLLKPHLTEDNHQGLLRGVSGASVRRAKEWLAARFPVPYVPSTIRKQPERRAIRVTLLGVATEGVSVAEAALNGTGPSVDATLPAAVRVHDGPPDLGATSPAAARVHDGPPDLGATSPAAARVHEQRPEPDCFHAGPPVAAPPARVRIEPLSEDRFLVKFTASRRLRDKLEQARDLMSHANPNGAFEVLLERAIDLLITQMQRNKQGRTGRPQENPRPAKDAHVTRAARREVMARDGWRCSFVADNGRRCDAHAFLEFDHETPKGRGGSSRPENLRLLCRAHNRAAAERVYGKAHVSRAIAESRSKVAKSSPSPRQEGCVPANRDP